MPTISRIDNSSFLLLRNNTKMKFDGLAVFAFAGLSSLGLAAAQANNNLRGLGYMDVVEEDGPWYNSLVQEVDSMPSSSPTPPPTGSCSVDVTIDCVDLNGTPCEDLVAPEGTCSVGDDIGVLRFRVRDCSCEDSANFQEANFICGESEPPTPLDGPVTISCFDASDSRPLGSSTVSMGGTIDVRDPTSDILPDTIRCEIVDGTGVEIQQVTFNSSGDVDLFLKDKFGFLELESCEVDNTDIDCIIPIVYSYVVTNTGTLDMDITLLERERNGVTVDLIGLVTDITLVPGAETTVVEMEDLDICTEGLYKTTVRVEADPPEGVPCFDEDEYEFEVPPPPVRTNSPSAPPSAPPSAGPTPSPSAEPTPPPTGSCGVDVTIDCVDENGTPCEELRAPPGECSVGDDIGVLRFKLVDCTCEDSDNDQGANSICSESSPPTPLTGPVTVICVDASDGRLMGQATISEGGTIDVRDPNSDILPDSIRCEITDESGAQIQEVTFNSSGEVDLFLKDKFGYLELEACEVDGAIEDCIIPIVYSYTVTNTGTLDMDITLLERERNGVTVNLIGLVTDITLMPMDQTTVVEMENLDICTEAQYVTTVRVEADPPEGVPCFDEDQYVFEVPELGRTPAPSTPPSAGPTPSPSTPPSTPPTAGPTPSPSTPPSAGPTPSPSAGPTPPPTGDCNVIVEIDCVDENGTPCEDLVAPVGTCSIGDDIGVLRFRIQDCTCDDSDNDQGSNFICGESAPPTPLTGPVTVTCVDASDDRLMVQETLSAGDFIDVQDPTSDILPDSIRCEVVDAAGAEIQQVTFDSSGEVDLFLKDKFGVLELEACEVDGVVEDCIIPIIYSYEISNTGTLDMDITLLTRERNGVTVDLIESVPDRSLVPGQSTTATEVEQLDICTEATYTTTVRVEADPPEGVPCFDEDTYVFDVPEIARTPAPSTPPSAGPTPTPSTPPSAGPTPTPSTPPSAGPTPTPSTPPSAGPTPSPSASPTTPGPTPSPSTPPSATPTPPPTGECAVEVVIDCVDEFGTPCEELVAPLPSCSIGSDIEVLRFRIRDCVCSDSDNDQGDDFFCIESDPPVAIMDSVVTVSCFDDTTDGLLAQQRGAAGDFLIVENPVGIDGVLPGVIRCEVVNAAGRTIQQVTFDSSGTVDLSINDKFGVLELESCQVNNVNLDCVVPITYSYIVTNVGTNGMDISLLERERNGVVVNLLPLVTDLDLDPGQSTSVTEVENLNICLEANYKTFVRVEATPPAGVPCLDDDEYEFNIVLPTPAPTMSMAPSAAPTESGVIPCGLNITLEPDCPVLDCGWDFCEERPFRMQFLYRGGACSETEIRRCGVGKDPDLCTCEKLLVPPEGWEENKITCEDFGAGPPEFADFDTWVWIQSIEAGETDPAYFEGPVRVGTAFDAVTEDDKVAANMDLFVYECNNCTADSTIADRGELVQHVVFHSSCSQELYLADIYGGFQLIEFESAVQLISLFRSETVNFNSNVQLQSGTDLLVLSSASMVVVNDNNRIPPQNVVFDVAGQVVPPPLSVGADFTLVPNSPFTAVATVEGTLNGRVCSDLVTSAILCESPNP